MGHGVHMTRDLGQHTDEGGANINRLQLRDQKNLEEYKHEPLDPDDWLCMDDNRFADQVAQNMVQISGVDFEKQSSTVCDRCRDLLERPLSRHTISVVNLQATSSQCCLCALLLHATLSRKWRSETRTLEAVLKRDGSKITFDAAGEKKRVLSIGQMPGQDSAARHNNIQICLPQLVESGTPAHAELLRQWLQDCDANHRECWCPPVDSDWHLPSRLLDIGTNSAPHVRLVKSSKLRKEGKQNIKFTALSYPWGDTTTHKHSCTTIDNYKQHTCDIPLQNLPVLLQHAIQVTRDLHIEYLWVDALCIIQGTGGDFNKEAERMEDVFSAAYCVIAASRAKGVSDGLVGRRKPREVVILPDHTTFVTEDIDDFQHDVLEGYLNNRGWVLQERALARRTIYFAERQTYWECGKGIRCETFTKMTNKQAAFLGDPNFPQMAKDDTKGARIRLFESLYEQYCQRHFTNDYDKPMAIAGLERRLCRAFDTDGGFGLFNIYLERSLLWQRDTTDSQGLKRIKIPPGREYVPSWSWMAYRGNIKFLDLPFDGIDWMKHEYRSPWTPTSSNAVRSTRSVRERSTSTLQVIARNFDLGAKQQVDARSTIVWDGAQALDGTLKCVAIGKLRAETGLPTQMHYVLILKQTELSDTYERVGVGCLRRDNIVFGGSPPWSVVR